MLVSPPSGKWRVVESHRYSCWLKWVGPEMWPVAYIIAMIIKPKASAIYAHVTKAPPEAALLKQSPPVPVSTRAKVPSISPSSKQTAIHSSLAPIPS